MQHADSTARNFRPSPEAILRALERLAKKEHERAARSGSGMYVIGDEFAGLDRLEREELDEE